MPVIIIVIIIGVIVGLAVAAAVLIAVVFFPLTLDNFSVTPHVWCPVGGCPMTVKYKLRNIGSGTVKFVAILGENVDFGPDEGTIISTDSEMDLQLTGADDPFASNGTGQFYTFRLFVDERLMASDTTFLLPRNPETFDLVREVSQTVPAVPSSLPASTAIRSVTVRVSLIDYSVPSEKYPKGLDICSKGVYLTGVRYLGQTQGSFGDNTDLNSLSVARAQSLVIGIGPALAPGVPLVPVPHVQIGDALSIQPPLLVGSEVDEVIMFQIRSDTEPAYAPESIIAFRIALTLACAN